MSRVNRFCWTFFKLKYSYTHNSMSCCASYLVTVAVNHTTTDLKSPPNAEFFISCSRADRYMYLHYCRYSALLRLKLLHLITAATNYRLRRKAFASARIFNQVHAWLFRSLLHLVTITADIMVSLAPFAVWKSNFNLKQIPEEPHHHLHNFYTT